MRIIKYIVIHEAACPLIKPSGAEFTIADIDAWHIERGFQRSAYWQSMWHPELKAAGYHFVLGVSGQVWEGRHEEEVPAAVKGFNTCSINICLIGQGKYTLKQWEALGFLVSHLQEKYPAAEVTGHCDPRFKAGKTCPDFKVAEWLADGKNPPEGHIA
jgi:hypothetical protein